MLGLELSAGNDEGSAWPRFVRSLVELAVRHKDRVNVEAIRPTVNWRVTRSEVSVAGGSVGE